MQNYSNRNGVFAHRIFAGSTLLAVLLLALILFPPAYASEATPAIEHVVAYRNISNVVSAEGTTEAVRQSTVAAQIAGQIIERKVNVGDTVKAGQVLLRIDPRAADQALAGSQSQVAEAQAGFLNATRIYERSKSLYAKNFISKAGMDQADADYKAARARVASLQAGAGGAATARSYTVITAPYNGLVGATPIEVGDMATPGRALITVFDPVDMRVVATLSQSSLRKIQMNKPARVEIPSLQKTLESKQITLIPIVDSRTHTAKLRLELGAVADLYPGQFARAYFVTGEARKLAIPEQAVLRRSEVTAVYVLDAEGSKQLRQVRVGEPSGDGFVEVLTGLREGERIALDPVKAGLSPTENATKK